jgi:RecA-family ATPase
MPYYICSLPNEKKAGRIPELISDDLDRIEEFARRWDRAGRGVYDCIAILKEGATRRCIENVGQLPHLPVDIDFKDIEEGPDEVDRRLRQLPLSPTEVRNSGGGRHVIYRLKEPVTAGEPEFARACDLLKRLVTCLCGDMAPTHPAALLRRPRTHNTKRGEPVLCEVVWRGDDAVDITEIETLLDLLGDAPLLTRREPERERGNGHDRHSPFERKPYNNSEGPLDVDTCFQEMQPTGASVNDVQPRVILSLLQKAIHPDDVIGLVVDRTMAMADRAGLGWDHRIEAHCVTERVKSSLNKLHREYDPDTGTIPPWLAGDFHEEWGEALKNGLRPLLRRNQSGWYVCAYGRKKAPNDGGHNDRRGERTDGSKQNNDQTSAPRGPFVLRPFVPFNLAALPPRQWLYGRHYQRGTVSATIAPGGFGKTSLCMVESVIMATLRNLLGEQPEERLRVWYHNGEDSLEELNRRLGAICLHYGIPQEELLGWFFMTSGNEFPLRVAKGYSSLEIDERLRRQIAEAVSDNQIDVAVLDPLVTLHGVPEGDNMKMYAVIRIFAEMADACGCGFELAHHTRKLLANNGPSDYTIDDARGASSIRDAVRAARMLNHMSQTDAEAAGISAADRMSYFRVDRAKANNAPPARVATWRKFVNVDLPNGDEVGVVVPWEFPGQGASTPEKAAAERKAEDMFLRLLDQSAVEGSNVSARVGPNYAPARFAKMPATKAEGVSKAFLIVAMQRLLDAGRIKSEAYGSGAKEGRRLVRSARGPDDGLV